MFTYALYSITGLFLVGSYLKDKHKTKKALHKALKAFNNMLPEFAGVLMLVGLAITMLTPETISHFIGDNSGFLGMLVTGTVGAITLIPGFVAFPLASTLMQHGAGVMQVAVFISTLMMVGVVTAPLEIRYFGRKETLLRNSFSFLFAFFVAVVLGVIIR